jgi:hypothetical protein
MAKRTRSNKAKGRDRERSTRTVSWTILSPIVKSLSPSSASKKGEGQMFPKVCELFDQQQLDEVGEELETAKENRK